MIIRLNDVVVGFTSPLWREHAKSLPPLACNVYPAGGERLILKSRLNITRFYPRGGELLSCRYRCSGFYPAGAGNTPAAQPQEGFFRVYPRWRGNTSRS
ncbi:hypothetical protein KCP73_17795 [Salmonella enterica subsp. enterica]|nr:hypothetical protein KCP73_17795 [Salmonella enterica subsp. enterica]